MKKPDLPPHSDPNPIGKHTRSTRKMGAFDRENFRRFIAISKARQEREAAERAAQERPDTQGHESK